MSFEPDSKTRVRCRIVSLMRGRCFIALEHRAGPTETITGVEQAINLHPVARPLFDFLEVANIGDQRIVGFLTGPIVRHCIKDSKTPWLISQ